MSHAHRNYHGHRYCGTCYARVFKASACPRCGETRRLPQNIPGAICRECERKQPCIRCGKSNYAIGKVTSYGRVCKACAPYFREAGVCESCGASSKRLSRATRMGHKLRLCPKCLRADFGTCQACHRYRRLKDTDTGQRLCSKCITDGVIHCPECNNLMPAGVGSRCWGCYWTDLHKKRLKISCAVFKYPGMANSFEEFGLWLLSKMGPHTAALNTNKYLPFFLEMEQQWQAIPSYDALAKHFGLEGLRKYLRALRWLISEKHLTVDVKLKQQISEIGQIYKLLSKVSIDSEEGQLIEGYYTRLEEKLSKGKTTLRSIRLALASAVGYLMFVNLRKTRIINQQTLRAYLKNVPGQTSSIRGFINYLNTNCPFVFPLDMPYETTNNSLEKKLLSIMLIPRGGPIPMAVWSTTALAYFHDVPMSRSIKKLHYNANINIEVGVTIVIDGNSYWIPVP